MLVDVSPDMSMYNLLRRQGYEASYALAEFIDNAIHAFQMETDSANNSGSRLEISLKFYSSDYSDQNKRNTIIITDNGPGITQERLATAFKPANKPSKKGLSEFGIGMKAAAVWFSDFWELKTNPAGNKSYSFEFDFDKLLSNNQRTVDIKETSSASNSVIKTGTTLTLGKVRRPIDLEKYKDICSELIEIYQRFTYGPLNILDLKAEFNGTPRDLNYQPPEYFRILKAPIHKNVGKTQYAVGDAKTWSIPINFVYQGCNVTGQIMLLETGSYKNPGLALFRYGRLITGSEKFPYIPQTIFKTANKYGRQRMFGQLDLDGLPVNYTKDRFEFDEDEFLNLIANTPGFEELFRQASDYRAKTVGTDDLVEVGSFEELEKKTGKKNGTAKPKVGAKKKATKPNDDKGKAQEVIDLSTILKSLLPNVSSMSLKRIIEENIFQYLSKKEISTAICFRMVLEIAVLDKIEKDFPSYYPQISDYSIQALINYMYTNKDKFFDEKKEHKIIKCLQSNYHKKSTTQIHQIDTVLLNNTAHGHFQPSMQLIDQIVANLEPLLKWAYS